MHGPLRYVARRLIVEGHLPTDPATPVFGGPSSKSICRLCGQFIAAQAPEIKIVFVTLMAGSRAVLVHPDCYAIWIAEARSSTPA